MNTTANMEVKIKRLASGAMMPKKAHPTDAGFDLYVSRCGMENGLFVCHTDVAFEIPKGFVGYVFPRSSVSNMGLIMSNSVGVIDAGYRGEVSARFKADGWFRKYGIGDRFAQIIIMPIPDIEFIEVDELSDTDRGVGGYGSSGK